MHPPRRQRERTPFEAKCVIDGLGGKENILSVDNCFTRLRVNIIVLVQLYFFYFLEN